MGAPGAGAYSATKGALESKPLFSSYLAVRPSYSCAPADTLTPSTLLGMVDCLREEVSPFGIQCCLVTPGFYRTNIFTPTNMKTGPQLIADYDKLNTEYQAGLADLNMGDPRKATDRIVDMVRSKGKAAGKAIPARFPLGADAVAIIRDSCTKKLSLCDEWEDITSDTQFDAGK